MDKHKQINESILLGYFTGTLSIPLQQEVEDWISASEENKKIARDIQSICLATETLTCIRQTDSGTALNKVKSKIHSHRKILYPPGYNVLRQSSSFRLSFPLYISH